MNKKNPSSAGNCYQQQPFFDFSSGMSECCEIFIQNQIFFQMQSAMPHVYWGDCCPPRRHNSGFETDMMFGAAGFNIGKSLFDGLLDNY